MLISNMVSEPLLWHFLSSLVFISVTSFSTSFLPSQQLPQPLAVEPPTSSSRCLCVPDLQPLSLRSPTPHRPLHVSLSPWILLRLCFYRYHWDRLVPIYKLVEASQPLEITRALMRYPKILRPSSRASTRLQPSHTPPHASRARSAPADVSPRWRHRYHVTTDITRHVSWCHRWQAVDPRWPYRWLVLT